MTATGLDALTKRSMQTIHLDISSCVLTRMRTNLRGTYGAGDVERRGSIIGAADRLLAAVGGGGLKGVRTPDCSCCMGAMEASCGGGDALNSPPFTGGAVRAEACKPSKFWMILAATGWLKTDAH